MIPGEVSPTGPGQAGQPLLPLGERAWRPVAALSRPLCGLPPHDPWVPSRESMTRAPAMWGLCRGWAPLGSGPLFQLERCPPIVRVTE